MEKEDLKPPLISCRVHTTQEHRGQGSREALEVWFTQVFLSLSLALGNCLIYLSSLGAIESSIESKLVNIRFFREVFSMDNPIMVHAQNIQATAFGDKRLEKRGRHCIIRCCNTSL